MVEQLVADLEALRSGRLSDEEFRLRHPIPGVSAQLDEIVCNLEHYFADRDIRARDPDYQRFQDGELAKLIDHLGSGHFDQAARIDFVSMSPA